MKIRLDKELEWMNGQPVTKYYVWADDRCVDVPYRRSRSIPKV